jgi:hypothetical protein
MADRVENLPEDCGGKILAKALRAINTLVFNARKNKLTKSQHVMFLLAEIMIWCEVGNALCHKAAVYEGDQDRSVDFMKACARLFAGEAIEKVYVNGIRIARGCGPIIDEAIEALNSLDMGEAMKDSLQDMDLVSAELVA